MSRSTWVNAALVALALGTFGVIWATREAPSTGELLARKGKLLPVFQKDAVTSITLTRDGKELQLSSDTDPDHVGEFRIVRPRTERADTASVKQLLDALDTAGFVRPADDVSSGAAGLSAKSPQLRIEMGKRTAILRVGGPAATPAGAHFMEVTADSAAKRYVVSASVDEDLDIPLNKLRDPRLFVHAPSELFHISLSASGPSLHRRDHGLFFQSPSCCPTQLELANPEQVRKLFDGLSRLVADPLIEVDEAHQELSTSHSATKLELFPKASEQSSVSLSIVGHDGRFIVLAEEPGQSPRAGYVPANVGAELQPPAGSLDLNGVLATRMDEVEELRLTRGSQKLVLTRKDKGFVLKAPHAGEVALDAGNERISGIIALLGTRPETHDLEKLGLAKPDGELTVQVTGENAVERHEQTVTLGSVRQDGSICAERQLDHVRLCFPPEATKLLTPDPSLLKRLALNEFAPSDLVWLETQTTSLKQRVERRDDAGYALMTPVGYNYDGALVTDAVQALGTLQAVRWVSAVPEPGFGLDHPELRVRFELKDPAGVHELVVGGAAKGGHYAQLPPDPAVFLLSDQTFEALSLPFLDRALCPDASEQTSVYVKSAKGEGTLAQRGMAFAQYPDGLKEMLRSLKAEFAVHTGPAKPNEGLGHPTLELTYSAGRQVKVIVGKCDTLRDQSICYARRSDVDATFALSSRIAGALRTATSNDIP